MDVMTGNQKCWICKRTKKEVDEYGKKINFQPRKRIPKWLYPEHIVPIRQKDAFVICPFCIEAIYWSFVEYNIGRIKQN
jgi:hypothetical protein